MAQARDFLSESGTIMILTDPAGVVLQSEGDPPALEAALDIRLMAGASWSEVSSSTNAIGTALSSGEANTPRGAVFQFTLPRGEDSPSRES